MRTMPHDVVTSRTKPGEKWAGRGEWVGTIILYIAKHKRTDIMPR